MSEMALNIISKADSMLNEYALDRIKSMDVKGKKQKLQELADSVKEDVTISIDDNGFVGCLGTLVFDPIVYAVIDGVKNRVSYLEWIERTPEILTKFIEEYSENNRR